MAEQLGPLGDSFMDYRAYFAANIPTDVPEGTDPEGLREWLYSNLAYLLEPFANFLVTVYWDYLVNRYFNVAKILGFPDQVEQAANELAEDYAQRLVGYLHQQSADAFVKAVIAQVNRGVPARKAVANAASAYGVTERRMNSLTTMWERKEIKGATTTPLPRNVDNQIKQIVAADVMLRARTIDREEDFAATQDIKAFLWATLPDTSLIRWVTAADEQVCPICGPMNNKTRKPKEQFSLPNEMALFAPPVHVNCRCTIQLVDQPTKRRVRLRKAYRFQEHKHPRDHRGRWTKKPTRPPRTTYAEPTYAEPDTLEQFAATNPLSPENLRLSTETPATLDLSRIGATESPTLDLAGLDTQRLGGQGLDTAGLTGPTLDLSALSTNDQTLQTSGSLSFERQGLGTQDRSTLSIGQRQVLDLLDERYLDLESQKVIPGEIVEDLDISWTDDIPRMRAEIQPLDEPVYAVVHTGWLERNADQGLPADTEFTSDFFGIEEAIEKCWDEGTRYSNLKPFIENAMTIGPIEDQNGVLHHPTKEELYDIYLWALKDEQQIREEELGPNDEFYPRSGIDYNAMAMKYGAYDYSEANAPVLIKLEHVDINRVSVDYYQGETIVVGSDSNLAYTVEDVDSARYITFKTGTEWGHYTVVKVNPVD